MSTLPKQPVASVMVTPRMQEHFANLSGDWNPIHMDAVAARRTPAGRPVVHGIHSLLWALESLARNSVLTKQVSGIKLRLLKWIYLGDLATLMVPAEARQNPASFDVQVHGLSVLAVELSFGSSSLCEEVPVDCSTLPLTCARRLCVTEMTGLKGTSYVASCAAASAAFPFLAKLLGGRAVAELAATSYLIGMEAPGLNSTFSKLDVTLRADMTHSRSGLSYEVIYIDERFHKARIAVSGAALEGTLEAFVRLPPAEQATMDDIAARKVLPYEFAGMTALVVGGSRGLGEVTAKIVAAGGGRALISYAVGRVEAENVARQIRDWGGVADTLPYDARKSASSQIALLPASPSHLFYFATNPIFRPRYQVFSTQALEEFTRFYVSGFYDLCLTLLDACPPGSRNIRAYYPSSVFIEVRPPGMTEYSMAKAAGEILCRDMNLQLPGFNVSFSRLPRMPTDQTAGILPVKGSDPLDLLIPIVRERMSSMRTVL